MKTMGQYAKKKPNRFQYPPYWLPVIRVLIIVTISQTGASGGGACNSVHDESFSSCVRSGGGESDHVRSQMRCTMSLPFTATEGHVAFFVLLPLVFFQVGRARRRKFAEKGKMRIISMIYSFSPAWGT
jgi:hypothetical protein